MNFKNNRKEVIHSRLKKVAVKNWGYQEPEIEGFDPVVDLLFGACATELERLSSEIYDSQTHILEKVSQILLPEVNLRPKPAYSILYAKPTSKDRLTLQSDQFIFEKEIPGKTPDKPEIKKLFFSPVPGMRLLDAEIIHLATNEELIKVTGLFTRESVLKSSRQDTAFPNSLWMGLKINPSVTSLKDVSFFVDWINNPEKESLLNLVNMAKWFIDGKEAILKEGYNHEIQEKYASETIEISSYLDINLKTEKTILQFFEPHFFTIIHDILPGKTKYPEEFQNLFDAESLEKLKDELHWIRIDFPEIFPKEHLSTSFCLINAFPVINRKFHDSNRPYSLNKDLNIIPLITDDYFYTIQRIVSGGQNQYNETPYKRVGEMSPGTYSVRSHGVKRFDERDAFEYLMYLMELLREEHLAFEAVGSSLIEKELTDLQIIINRLRMNIALSNDIQNHTHFLLVKSEIEEDIWTEFWSTTGVLGNNLPAGSTAKNNDFDKKHLQLLLTTKGGKDPPDQFERIALFKNELLTRNRIVTKDDIKTACFAELGNELEYVNISRIALPSSDRFRGFQNCIRVGLCFHGEKSPEEKENMADHMAKILELKSSCVYKYKVESVY